MGSSSVPPRTSTCSHRSREDRERSPTQRDALLEAGYDVDVTRRPEAQQGEFARLEVTRGDDTMHVDLARDWRRWPPVQLDVGPVLHIEDAVGSKTAALVARRAPRDFIDVALPWTATAGRISCGSRSLGTRGYGSSTSRTPPGASTDDRGLRGVRVHPGRPRRPPEPVRGMASATKRTIRKAKPSTLQLPPRNVRCEPGKDLSQAKCRAPRVPLPAEKCGE